MRETINSCVAVDSFRTGTPATNLIGRELALEIGDSTYRPATRSHVPGVTNKLADYLSRKHQPGTVFNIPQALTLVPETKIAIRNPAWYATKRGTDHYGE